MTESEGKISDLNHSLDKRGAADNATLKMHSGNAVHFFSHKKSPHRIGEDKDGVGYWKSSTRFIVRSGI